jgi:hypothetical protein
MDERNSNNNLALFISLLTKAVSATFMVATPLIFGIILYQGGFGSVPVYDRSGVVLFHINNVVAALIFCWLWCSINAVFFSLSKKSALRLRKHRDVA